VKIDLEKLGLQWRHADYIIVARDMVAVVERLLEQNQRM